MRALVCEAFGPVEGLRVLDVAPPALHAGEVRIDVHAAGVNYPDVLIVQGLYQIKPPLPFSPGCEVAGVVSEVGPEVDRFRVGDRVLAWLGHGGFAEQAVAPVDAVFAIPGSIDFATASVMLMTYGTAYHALVQRAALKPGESVAVLGAGGGVGSACVELARALGAHVIACAGSARKLAAARAQGAEATIDYGRDDLRDALKAATGGRGVDVICDPVGGALAEPAFRAIAWQGRYLVIGFAGGEIPRLPLNLPLLKGAAAVGVYWGEFVRRDPRTNAQNVNALLALLTAGDLAPPVSRTYPLEKAVTALESLHAREAVGKLAVQVRGA